MFSGQRRGAAAVAVAMAGALALVGLTAPAALADDTVTLTPATQTVEYGQFWSVSGPLPNDTAICGLCSPGTAVITASGETKTISNFGAINTLSIGDYDLMPDRILGAGTHSLSATYTPNESTLVFATNTVSITITPAKITTTTVIAADPNNPSNAIITSQLTGDYISQLPSCQCEAQNGYLLPAGTWNLTVTDSSGKTVLTKSVDQAASGLPTFVNYWSSVPAGETFSAISTFTPTTGASNFALTSQKFSWTSKKATGSQNGVSPSSAPKPPTRSAFPFALPAIFFWGALVVAIILLALDIVLLVLARRGRATRPATTNGVPS